MSKPSNRTFAHSILENRLLITFSRYFLIFLIAFIIFGIILFISGVNPIAAISDAVIFTLGSPYGLSEVIVKMIPLIFTTIAVALPSKVGLINVGAEGQLYFGALFSTWVALTFPQLPIYMLLPLMMIVGMAGGAVWAFLPGWLRAKGLVNETISSLLMNYIAPSIVSFFVYGPWRNRENVMSPQTPDFVIAARLPSFFRSRIHMGLVVGIIVLVIYWFIMKYSRWGLEMKAIGGNPNAALRNGIPIKKYLIIVMCLGGAIAGLAGMSEISGIHGRLRPNFSPGFGFMGFLISWLTGGNPLGILLMTFLVAVIILCGDILQIKYGLPFAVVNILLAIALFIVLARIEIIRGKKK
jgi:ABC-type uncharacterized transport system permease subunit